MTPESLPPEIGLEARDAVRIVTLRRADRLNAFNAAMHGGLAAVWEILRDDVEARAVVIVGDGKAFSAGGDIAWFGELSTSDVERRRVLDEGRRIVDGIVACPVPVISAVNGPAVGLGASIAGLSDLVVMAEDAYLADPHVSVGLVAGDGTAAAWPLLMSLLRAKEFIFTGDRIDAQQALTLGLANRVAPAGGALDVALELAARIARQPAWAVRDTKRALNLHLRAAVQTVLDLATATEELSFLRPEHHERVQAFLERGAGR